MRQFGKAGRALANKRKPDVKTRACASSFELKPRGLRRSTRVPSKRSVRRSRRRSNRVSIIDLEWRDARRPSSSEKARRPGTRRGVGRGLLRALLACPSEASSRRCDQDRVDRIRILSRHTRRYRLLRCVCRSPDGIAAVGGAHGAVYRSVTGAAFGTSLPLTPTAGVPLRLRTNVNPS